MNKVIVIMSIVVILISNFALAGKSPESSNQQLDFIKGDKNLFGHFPEGHYSPNGYLTNPYHTAVLNRSGVLRSVPPLGFGFWARPLPWPYGGAEFGFGLSRHRNYLSLLHLAINIDDKMFYRFEDFENNSVNLHSQYHTQNMMSYDFEYNGLIFKAMYFQVDEHSLVCIMEMKNTSATKKDITIHATNIYGDIYKRYWGCDGIVSNYDKQNDVSISKFFADGDMFVLGADENALSYKATTDDSVWNKWLAENDVSDKSETYTSLRIKKKKIEQGKSRGHVNSMLSYKYNIDPGKLETSTFVLSRGVTGDETINRYKDAMNRSRSVLLEKLADDKHFYKNTPFLTGAWSEDWKNGFIYHLETIRMNIHPPVGIYNHYWDGMQVHTPRVVLGESAIDAMCLSYADMELAKDVILGTFEDAVDDNIPCSREDGSLNLVCGNGKETGTAPIWGLPFHVIHSFYLRDNDAEWIKKLYPHMKSYINWWLKNRTDDEGWFHCACSWESGQDGSKRFLVGDVAESAENVRTIDIEAAMAHAIKSMVLFAEVADETGDIKYWKDMADKRIRRTRDMFVDGRFRDFDARSGKPIILENYYSVMMLSPISFGIASRQQMEDSKEIFDYFKKNYRFWLEWPSFLFPFSEAAWNAGRRELLSDVLVNSGKGIFPGTNSKKPLYIKAKDAPGLSPKFSYRLPGVAAEWWPYKRGDQWAGGCENYGWGATFPTLLIRNLIGFRETSNSEKEQFQLAPALSKIMFEEGKAYGISNLSYRDIKVDINYQLLTNNEINVQLSCKSQERIKLLVSDEQGKVLKTSDSSNDVSLDFNARNFDLYTVTVKNAL